MSSIDFHEDEWGRHFSYAPALHGTRRGQPFSLLHSLRAGFSALKDRLEALAVASERDRTLRALSPSLRSDILGEDDFDISSDSRTHLRDTFGRPVL